MEPAAEPFIRPYVSGLDYLRNRYRWILALHDAPPNVLAGMPKVRERIARRPRVPVSQQTQADA